VKAILRSAVLAATAATSIAMMGSPASAQDVVVFTADATIACFGCGPSTGTAHLTTVAGTISGEADADFDLNEPPATCPVTGDANGTVSGDINVTFGWVRVGAIAVITTNGDITGAGVAAFTVEGNPCGGANVHASVVGAVAGV
jgi:hypothetical protein